MSTLHDDIRIAFSTDIKSIADANSIPIAWEGEEFDPNVDAPNQEYARVYLLAVGTTIGSLGSGGLDRSIGLFQISVYAGKESGSKRLNELCGLLQEAVQVRSVKSYNGVDCRITSVNRNPPDNDAVYRFLALDIEFETYTSQGV